MFEMNFFRMRNLLVLLILASVIIGQDADFSDPMEMDCEANSGIENFTCNIMKTLLNLGPMVAIIALLVGGVIYVYANIFVTADQRGRYHSLATSLAVGAVILAALVGGVGFITNAGMTFLQPAA